MFTRMQRQQHHIITSLLFERMLLATATLDHKSVLKESKIIEKCWLVKGCVCVNKPQQFGNSVVNVNLSAACVRGA